MKPLLRKVRQCARDRVGRQPQAFIVLSGGRTGSSWLAGRLGDHPNLYVHGEIFNWRVPFSWEREEHVYDRLAYARAVFERKHFPWVKRVGCKAMYGNILGHPDPLPSIFSDEFLTEAPELRYLLETKTNPADFFKRVREGWEYLRDRPDLKIIHLRRRNLLRRLVSSEQASTLLNWTGTPSERRDLPGVRLNVDNLAEHFQTYRNFERDAAAFFEGCDLHEVYYEDLVDHEYEHLENIQKFLQIPIRRLTKQPADDTRKPLRKIIKNYEVVAETLRPTQWRTFLEETP